MTSPSSTLVDLLHPLAEARGDALVYRFLQTGEVDGPSLETSYREFDRRSRAVAVALQSMGGTGERALMLYPPGLELMVGFFGCLYAGTIAVPAYPPDPARLDRTLARLRSIVSDCKARFVVTTRAIKSLASTMLRDAPELAALTWIATDDVPLDGAASWKRPEIGRETTALLQYTSGSTGDPKGVVVTHGNLLHNEEMITRAFGEGARRDHVAWLPLYHDMGLIGKVIHAPFAGVTCTFLSPLDFLRRPARWLRAMSRYRAGFSAAPNFAYELCVRKVDDREIEGIDLSHWTAAVNAAEPVRTDTLERFVARFARYGFRRETFAPAYGLAEGTLLVSAGAANAAPPVVAVSARALEQRIVTFPENAPDARSYVSCGRAWGDQTIRIVDPETCSPCVATAVGEIWVAGESVGRGYWNRPEETRRTFEARIAGSNEGPFLRTGDLGFLRDGELYVSGRLKDLIILRGRNHLPNDIEHTVELAHIAVRGGCSAAFAIDVKDEEALVVVAEIEPGPVDRAAVASAVRRAVGEAHDVQVHAVVLIEARTIPKTTSGKIQRRACRAAWTSGALRVIETFTGGDAPAGSQESAAPLALSQALAACAASERLERVVTFIRAEIARALHQPVHSVDVNMSLVRLGLDSLDAVELRERLEAALGVALPAAVDAQSPTAKTLGEALVMAWLGSRVAVDALRRATAVTRPDEEEMKL